MTAAPGPGMLKAMREAYKAWLTNHPPFSEIQGGPRAVWEVAWLAGVNWACQWTMQATLDALRQIGQSVAIADGDSEREK